VSAAPSTAPTAITELPVPKSATAGAAEAYHAGLAALRAGRRAAPDFERALTLDPSMTSAHVQILSCGIEGIPLDTMRAHYRSASEQRASLGERDRMVLDAYTPLVAKEPTDYPEATRRLRAAVDRFPGDVQLWDLLGGFGIDGGLEASLGAYESALALDPHDAQAMTNAAERDAYLGRFSAAKALLARCLEDAPTAGWCRDLLARLLASEGSCVELETRAREALIAGPTDPDPTEWLAQSLAGRAPIEAVAEALQQSASRMTEPVRAIRAVDDAITLALFRGDFTAAIAHAHTLEERIKDSTLGRDHGRVASVLLDALTESGDSREATSVGRAFLARSSAWEAPSGGEDIAMSEDAVPSTLASLRSIGALDATAFATARDRWVTTWDTRAAKAVHNFVWMHGYAESSTTPEDAFTALGALAKYEPIPPFRPRTIGEAFIGRTYLLAGRVDEAIPWLERATRACSALRFPVTQTRTFYWLGLARESKGDVAGACAAHKVVIDRWAKATPRSVTLQAARTRRSALHCPE
ncbi:MAG: tetratricopeptide repeat protein, partial [Polyangiales bacterium]